MAALTRRIRLGSAVCVPPMYHPMRLEGAHGWVEMKALRRLSPLAGDPGWEVALEGMAAFAAGKGWVDGTEAARAHLDADGQDRAPIGT